MPLLQWQARWHIAHKYHRPMASDKDLWDRTKNWWGVAGGGFATFIAGCILSGVGVVSQEVGMFLIVGGLVTFIYGCATNK